MSHSIPTPPTTPIKGLLGEMIRDDKNDNLLHFRVPSRFVSSGGQDSIFAWLDHRKYIWRKTENSRAGSHHYLDIRRAGDPAAEVLASQEDVISSFANAQPQTAVLSGASRNGVEIDWNVQQAYETTDTGRSPFLPAEKLHHSGSQTSLFSEASSSPLPSSSAQASTTAPGLCLPPGGKLVYPQSQSMQFSETVAPKDVFSALRPSQALPLTPTKTPGSSSHRLPSQPTNAVASSSRRAHNVQKIKKQTASDDSDFHASDHDGSDGEDGSEFDITSSKGRTQKLSNRAGLSNAKTPLYCDFPGCKFVQRNGRAVDLLRHSETHKNPETRPKYACEMCGHVVSRKDAPIFLVADIKSRAARRTQTQ